jgi:DNA-binding MarR family transcriptional regulator
MGRALQKRLASRRFEGPHHEALLNVIIAGGHMRGMINMLFEGEGLTQGQYNVMRILNGAYPNGYPRGEIARRMLDRAPDLTRMLDRLVKRGLVERSRDAKDARQSIARITPKGRRFVASKQIDVNTVTRYMEQHLSAAEARTLSRLCERLYGELKED